MQATRSNVFALKKSGLEAFLYADAGIEANGSMLTILSVLARLGKDPWTEAARWAALPKARVIDSLTQSLEEMPLAPSALAGARETAVRLVQLLPTNTQSLQLDNAGRSATGTATATDTPKMMPITLLYFALAVWMALNVLLVSKPSSGVLAPSAQSTTTSDATTATTKLPATGAPVTNSSRLPDRQ
jgi:hypothetical protein